MSGWLRRNAVLVVLGVAAAGLLVWYVHSWSAPASTTMHEHAVARARFSACLIGAPVEHGPPGASRLRAIQLQPPADWPKRCARYASELEQLLSTSEHPHPNGASTALEKGNVFEHESVQHEVESLLTAPEEEPIIPLGEDTSDVPLPPSPAMLPRELVPVARSIDSVTDLGEHDLALMVGDQIACRFAAHDGGLEPTAHCSYPADAVAFDRTQERYLRTTSTRDVAVVANGHVRTYETGEMIMGANVLLASEYAGTVYGWEPAQHAVVRRDPKGTVSTLRLPHELPGRAALVADQLVWNEGKHVVAASVAGPKLGAVTEVTALEAVPVWRDVCSTTEVAAVLLAQDQDDEHYRIAVRANGAWTVSDVGPRYTLSCAGDVVTGVAISRADDSHVKVDRVDCARGHCTSGSATIAGRSKLSAVAAIGDATIVVWIDDAVHAVSGPLAQLTSLPSFPIYDGFDYDRLRNRQTTEQELLHGISVVGRGASAIVLLNGEGVKLVHVRDHKAERVNVVFD